MKIKDLIKSDAFCGMLLCTFAVIAFIIANSPLYWIHDEFFNHKLATIANQDINLHFIVNEVLMSLFFLQVGKEIKYEMLFGTLSTLKHAMLPVIAALGGVIAPATIYLLLNDHSKLMHGWAIPTATDIAFVVGVFSIIGKNFPHSIRIVLLSIAVIDDIIAILIITIFYSQTPSIYALLLSFGTSFALWLYLKYYGNNKIFFILGFAAIWLSLFSSGIHPTLSGVIVGFLLPQKKQNKNPLLELSVNFIIMPAFTLANAAIKLGAIDFHNHTNIKLIVSIILALFIGKPLGIFVASFISTKTKLCHLPSQANYKHMLLIGLLAGIGFTMALFTILLSFKHSETIDTAKIGVTVGSIISAIIGLSYGFLLTKTQKMKPKSKKIT